MYSVLKILRYETDAIASDIRPVVRFHIDAVKNMLNFVKVRILYILFDSLVTRLCQAYALDTAR